MLHTRVRSAAAPPGSPAARATGTPIRGVESRPRAVSRAPRLLGAGILHPTLVGSPDAPDLSGSSWATASAEVGPPPSAANPDRPDPVPPSPEPAAPVSSTAHGASAHGCAGTGPALTGADPATVASDPVLVGRADVDGSGCREIWWDASVAEATVSHAWRDPPLPDGPTSRSTGGRALGL